MSRKRRTKSEIAELEKAIVSIVSETKPVSIRHIFYRLVGLPCSSGGWMVEKTTDGYRQVANRLKRMRRGGSINYDDIVDPSRVSMPFDDGWSSLSDFMSVLPRSFKLNAWVDSDVAAQVWCESRSIAGMVEPVCREFRVDLFPCGGHPSITYCRKAAVEMVKPTGIVYIGDFDPAGIVIGRNLEKELGRHSEHAIDFHRLAVNQDQIDSMKLPTKLRKPTEIGLPEIDKTVEAEAINPNTLRAMLRDALADRLDMNLLAEAKDAEADGYAFLTDMIANVDEMRDAWAAGR